MVQSQRNPASRCLFSLSKRCSQWCEYCILISEWNCTLDRSRPEGTVSSLSPRHLGRTSPTHSASLPPPPGRHVRFSPAATAAIRLRWSDVRQDPGAGADFPACSRVPGRRASRSRRFKARSQSAPASSAWSRVSLQLSARILRRGWAPLSFPEAVLQAGKCSSSLLPASSPQCPASGVSCVVHPG